MLDLVPEREAIVLKLKLTSQVVDHELSLTHEGAL